MSYVTEITELFLAHCPGVTILDPMEYALIAEWKKQGIPLNLIRTVVDEGCADWEKKAVKVESIAYFQEAIQEKYLNWLQTRAEKF